MKTSFELKGYFNNKSIQQNFRFYVTFIDNPFNVDLVKRIGIFPLTENWHVLSVTTPQYDFKKEVQNYGPLPRSYPYMDYDGMEFKVEFEEDKWGTIGNLVTYLQRRVVDDKGIYTPPGKVKIPRVIVTTLNENNLPVGIFTFHQCYYLQCSENEYRYGSNESVKYNVTFNSDFMTAHFPLAIGGLITKGIGLGQKIKDGFTVG
jgi:hypothetical protein